MKQMMARSGRVLAALALVSAAWIQPAAAEPPLLERYTLESTGNNPGIGYQFYDQSLGGGDAQSSALFRRGRQSATLQLKVWRVVPAGQIAFALLGERVEVRGFDADGEQIYAKNFVGLEQDGVYFGDSKSGRWARKLTGLPLTIRRIEVGYFGNYE